MSRRQLAIVVSTVILALLACTTGLAADPATALEQGLVAHWTFDEGQGPVAKDVTGGGHDAALTHTDWIRSPRGFAVRFDSQQDRAVYANVDSMNLSGDATLAVWVRTDASVAPTTHRLIFGDTGGTIQRSLNLCINEAGLRFEWADGARGDSISAPGWLLNGTWKHLVVTAAAREQLVTLYVDGEPIVRNRAEIPVHKTSIKERITGWFYNGFFQGDLDDIRLYSRALTVGEVQRLFAAQADVQVSAPTVLFDGTAPQPGGVASIKVRNWSKQPRSIKLEGPPAASREIAISPGAEAELPLGQVSLERVWRSRSDLFICQPPQQVGQPVLSVRSGNSVEPMPLAPVAAKLAFEPIQVQVKDPWQRTLLSGRTNRIQFDLRLAVPADQLRAGSLRIRLVSRETGQESLLQEVHSARAEQSLAIDVGTLPWGAYDMTVGFHDRAGREILGARRLATVLPGGRQQIRPLNNLATELLDARARGLLPGERLEFMNPRDGWVWFRAAGKCELRLGNGPLLCVDAGGPAGEAMRLLPAGKHTLGVVGAPSEVLVRAVPALLYNVYPSGPLVKSFGANTWERLRKHTLPNANMIESQVIDTPEYREWVGQGKSWLAFVQAPGLSDDKPWTAEEILRVWLNPGGAATQRERPGFELAKLSGVQVDEYFQGGHWSTPEGRQTLLATARSIAALAERPEYAGKQWIPFMVRMWGNPTAELLMKTTLGSGWPFSEEVYVGEVPTEAENRAQIQSRFLRVAESWELSYPGSTRRAIFTPMYAYLPYCTSNRSPQADFRVHLEMQMQVLANHPAFFGLWGVQPYRSNYVDEEILNCMGRLLRHYCIEGRAEPMLRDPYELRHLRNPDFDEGLNHWQAVAADEGTLTADRYPGYGHIEGRYPSAPYGDAFARMRRSAKAPNCLGQQIAKLQPGRLYSLKLISADLADLRAGQSRHARHALAVRVEGAQLADPGFHCLFPGAPSAKQFTPKTPFWMTYHWLRFRATDSTARLVISDWADPQTPGGPIGQELAINFVEVQPVLED